MEKSNKKRLEGTCERHNILVIDWIKMNDSRWSRKIKYNERLKLELLNHGKQA